MLSSPQFTAITARSQHEVVDLLAPESTGRRNSGKRMRDHASSILNSDYAVATMAEKTLADHSDGETGSVATDRAILFAMEQQGSL